MEGTSSLVASGAAPAVAVAETLSQPNLADSPAAYASIVRYLAAAERVRALMDLSFKVCLGLAAVVVLAWALGALPGAVKLF
jgi:hypothetical protein